MEVTDTCTVYGTYLISVVLLKYKGGLLSRKVILIIKFSSVKVKKMSKLKITETPSLFFFLNYLKTLFSLHNHLRICLCD